jgi:hypothetical protein
MPVVGKELAIVAVQDAVDVARFGDAIRLSVADPSKIDDRVPKRDAELEISAAASQAQRQDVGREVAPRDKRDGISETRCMALANHLDRSDASRCAPDLGEIECKSVTVGPDGQGASS